MSPRKPAQDAMRKVSEAAQQLGLEKSQVYKLIRNGHLRHNRYPSTGDGDGTIRVPQTEIDRFLKDTKIPASAS